MYMKMRMKSKIKKEENMYVVEIVIEVALNIKQQLNITWKMDHPYPYKTIAYTLLFVR